MYIVTNYAVKSLQLLDLEYAYCMFVDSVSRLVLQRRNTVFRKINLFPLSDERLGNLVLFFGSDVKRCSRTLDKIS